jgi:hypothetical protein
MFKIIKFLMLRVIDLSEILPVFIPDASTSGDLSLVYCMRYFFPVQYLGCQFCDPPA